MKHGMSKTTEYRTWYAMLHRCTNPKNANYRNYGGRGIGICKQWRTDFLAFRRDVGEKPGPEYSLDRIDPNGHYEPGNVRWATPKVQATNRRADCNVGGAPRRPGRSIEAMRRQAKRMKPVLTVAQTAKLAGVTQAAIRKAIATKQLKGQPVIGQSGAVFGMEVRVVDLWAYYGLEL